MSSERTWAGYAPWPALVKPNGGNCPRSRAARPVARGRGDRPDYTFGPRIDRRSVAATAASQRAVDVPVAIVGLPNDELVPFDRNAARYARLIRHAQLTTVPGAGHFVFMPVCTLPGRLVAAAVCVDIATSPDSAAVHGTTAATLVRFSERTLGGR